MSKYRTEDGRVFNTEKAQKSWREQTRWDGRNQISVNTGSQWDHEHLYLSRKGQYYIERYSAYQGSTPSIELLTPEEAARWLLLNDEGLPDDLKQYEDLVEE